MHLIEVTEVGASKSQHEQYSPKKISKIMKPQYSNVSSNNDVEDEKPHSTSRSTSMAMVVYLCMIKICPQLENLMGMDNGNLIYLVVVQSLKCVWERCMGPQRVV